MAQNYAEYRGEQGESRVRAVIDEMSCLGYTPLHNLLLFTSRDKSTQIDHVIIDRFGILIIETKNVGGLLRGKSGEKNWTVCYPDGKKRPMLSPLEQNELHRKRLHQFLLAQGMRLRDNYLQSLIVFADGNIDALELNDADTMRVNTLSGARDFLRARYDFQPNEGLLTEPLIEGYAMRLRELDRSNDPASVARHLEQAKAAKSGRRPRRQYSRNYPSRRSTPTPHRQPSLAQSFGAHLGGLFRDAALNLVGLVAAVAVTLLVLGLAVPLFTKAFALSVASVQKSAAVEAAAPAPSADPALAFGRLREAAPDIAGAVTNQDSPEIGSERGLTTYTWQYLQKTRKGSVDVKTVSIALDTSGNIVGSP